MVKAIYGLKQAPRAWHAHLGSTLWSHGFVPSTADTSLFLPRRLELTMYLLLYVDDIVLISSLSDVVDKLVLNLRHDFSIKDLGPLHYFLGLEVTHIVDGLSLTQTKYSLDLVRYACMFKSKHVLHPWM